MRRIRVEVAGVEDVDPRMLRRAKFFAVFLPVVVVAPLAVNWLAISVTDHGEALVAVCLGVGAVTLVGVAVTAVVLLVRRPRR